VQVLAPEYDQLQGYVGERFFSLHGIGRVTEAEYREAALACAQAPPLEQVLAFTTVWVPDLPYPLREQEADAALLQRLAGEVSAAVERINEMGCLVKDLEQGLVDFYSLRDDEPVFLCWQFGEPAVSHWHPLDEGFASRQPIEGVFVKPPPFVN
jgi:hypothetical protein